MIELYINNRLCDVGRDFGVRLNRQLLNPGELNTKDAQYSYSVTLPPTSNNHAIFNYANIEETKDKFNREYKAELVINSVQVFIGLFRLSEVTRDKYKGNLYIPALKSIKDIFGEKKLNENPEYRVEFKDFAEWVSHYNTLAATDPQMAIFPYTLYGVLPKYPADNDAPRDSWDSNVRLGMQDLPPSINPLLMLQHVFKSHGYNLIGSALNDERLTRLYMSYKNETDYTQPWNYGRHAKIRVTGKWSNREGTQLEHGVSEINEDRGKVYACNLFDCNNSVITKQEDPGNNVLLDKKQGDDNRDWTQCQIHVPASGYYKIRLKAGAKFSAWSTTERDSYTGIRFVGTVATDVGYEDGFSAAVIGIKLLRDWGTGDFGISGNGIDGVLYKNNLPQNDIYDIDNTPKYVPTYNDGMILFIDPAQNENYLAGFQWGKKIESDINPRDLNQGLSQVNVAKTGGSWDASISKNEYTKLAINNPNGYDRYAIMRVGENEYTSWGSSEKFKMLVNNSPENYARRGQFSGESLKPEIAGEGELNCVVWLNAGELLTVVDVVDESYLRSYHKDRLGCKVHEVYFDLTLTPFRTDEDWLKVNSAGNGTDTMNWNDEVNFDTDSINLVGFLPADMKTDDFIDNFCKAFNLQLTQTDATTFELSAKQSKTAVSNQFINLDNLASVHDRSNTPLGLPSLYKLGFTVDEEEEGYELTKDNGGGEFKTGATEEKVLEQKSTFSYNWFKNIAKGNTVLPLAVITKHEVWTNKIPYPDAMKKRYTNLASRFWYSDGLLNDLGTTFDFNGKPLSIVKVSNELPGLSILNYKNQKLTILTNYFTLLINGSSHYTEVEGYLTPDQYEDLNGSLMAMFNGDLYHVAEISGYDPAGRNKTKIKLIRKI
jgi:hypothetical protein